MPQDRLRILHAIHDFLPRHRAGSEIYAFDLCQRLSARHHVSLLCAEYDPSRPHGHVTWRVQEDLPVIELVNNWVCDSFEETYRPPLIGERIRQTLEIVQPHVVHVHSLLNLSFDLTRTARSMGIPIVATLHDYTLVCPSGGQRVHQAENHVCESIEPERCARCFRQSPFHLQTTFGAVTSRTGGSSFLHRLAATLNVHAPSLAGTASSVTRRIGAMQVGPADIVTRLTAARQVFGEVDMFAAPSQALATEFVRLGLDPARVRVMDYGFKPLERRRTESRGKRVRIGFVGTLVWHKGLHVLLDAVRGLPADQYELSVFGDPDVFPEYSRLLRAKAEGLPVRFLGPFERERVDEIYRQIDVLVVPSLWFENSPLVIHEAFMAGVPVVGARIGGITGLLGDGAHGWLYDPPGSTESLRAVLGEVIDRRDRLDEFAANPPKVKTISEDAEQWERIYTELTGKGHALEQTT